MPVDHYENFPVASWLLPEHLRQPVAAIYWFARNADDMADEGAFEPAERLRLLDAYRNELRRIAGGASSADPLFQRLAGVIAEHQLPLGLFDDLLDAFTQDVTQTRYADFSDLLKYCQRSANPIGRLLLRLYRAETPQHLSYSDAICTSLQLINHWQDVGIDWGKGRIYLPREDMARFSVSEAHIAEGRVDRHWRALMQFQVERARRVMYAGAPLGRLLPGRIGLELRMIIAGGLRILEKIERVGYDVFHRRPALTTTDWPLLLWRSLRT
ncbi:MAG: squalene synthase HpnC [Betaproteobacteria bacterium]|nr:squalene synthase HpnC [Betaproteobacteria bacterium]